MVLAETLKKGDRVIAKAGLPNIVFNPRENCSHEYYRKIDVTKAAFTPPQNRLICPTINSLNHRA